MLRSLDIGATGMLAQQMNVDVISNNIANTTTSGFKRQRAEFHDLIYQNKQRPGATSTDSGTTVPTGTRMVLSAPALPYIWLPMPPSPRSALKRVSWRKSRWPPMSARSSMVRRCRRSTG